jgi:hypothetical protein
MGEGAAAPVRVDFTAAIRHKPAAYERRPDGPSARLQTTQLIMTRGHGGTPDVFLASAATGE